MSLWHLDSCATWIAAIGPATTLTGMEEEYTIRTSEVVLPIRALCAADGKVIR